MSKQADTHELREDGLPKAKRYPWLTILKRLWPLVRPELRRLIVVVLTVGVAGVMVAITPLFAKPVIDNAIPSVPLVLPIIGWEVPYQGMDLAWALILSFLLLMAIRMVLWYIGQIQANWLMDHVLFRLRSMGFSHVQQLCQRFHDRTSPGPVYEKVFGSVVMHVSIFIQILTQTVVVQVVALVGSLAICIWLSPSLTAIIAVGTVLYVGAGRVIGPRIYKKTERLNSEHGHVTNFIMDHIRGVKSVQALAIEDSVTQNFDHRVWNLHVLYNKARREQIRLSFITEGISYLLGAAVLLGGAMAARNESIEVGTLVAFIGYQGQLVGTVSVLTASLTQFASAKASMDQFLTIIDTPSTVVDQPGAQMPENVRQDIRFEQLDFGYREGQRVLESLDLHIPYGQSVALVGRSGSGKTTLTNLMMRFYDADQGAVLLGDANVRDLPLKAYRRMFGIVLQEPYLFNATIAENLRCAYPGASDEQIWQALDRACATEFVESFDAGIHHHVGEGGRGLSGGQRARIAIARCMLMDTPFVLLDEPTAALDAESDVMVRRAIRALCEDRTVLMISHHLNTLRDVDRVLVMDLGKIVQDGSYQELAQSPGLFSKLLSLHEGLS